MLRRSTAFVKCAASFACLKVSRLARQMAMHAWPKSQPQRSSTSGQVWAMPLPTCTTRKKRLRHSSTLSANTRPITASTKPRSLPILKAMQHLFPSGYASVKVLQTSVQTQLRRLLQHNPTAQGSRRYCCRLTPLGMLVAASRTKSPSVVHALSLQT